MIRKHILRKREIHGTSGITHIGVDEESGLVHTVKATLANEHDVTVMSELLNGEEERAYGDSGYIGANKRPKQLRKTKMGRRSST